MLGVAGLIGVGIGVVAWRRRAARRIGAGAIAETETTGSAPASSPAPTDAAPDAEPDAAALFDLTLVDIVLEPVRLSLSLVNATLQYRLRLDNRATATVGPFALAIDMISANAAVPEATQLARDGTMIELRHEIAALAPGQCAETAGELRLPLTDVTPIRAGDAMLLVPLVRMRIDAGTAALSRALLIGEPPVKSGGPLRPFRLDQGPRVFSAIIQRPLAS